MSDKPQTMSGLSSVPNGTASQTILNRANRNSLASAIENRADANSDIGFARLCFVHWCHKGHTKVLKLSVGLRTQSVECSKLGKTRIIADAVTGWLEMPHFLNRMFHRHSTQNRRGMLLIILVIRVKYGMLIAAVPFSI